MIVGIAMQPATSALPLPCAREIRLLSRREDGGPLGATVADHEALTQLNGSSPFTDTGRLVVRQLGCL